MTTTDAEILQEMLRRITNPSKDSADEMAVDIFCTLVKKKVNLIDVAHDMLIQKIYSKSQEEALKAIELLEECMTNCGIEFQKKTAKFLFLNKLIQLVIDRHSGTPATIEVKKRIMDCLLLWTAEHTDKTKIREAYANLKKQVKFEHCTLSSPSNNVVIAEKPKSILGKDEDLVSKLLNAGGAENYKKANLLIQRRFSQENKRAERISQHKANVKETQDTIDLLNEMLNIYSNQPISNDNMETLRLLYNNCEELRYKFSVIHEKKYDVDEEILADTDVVYNRLVQCIERYKQLVNRCNNSTSSVTTTTTTPTTQKNTDIKATAINDVDILLGDELILPPINTAEEKKGTTTIADELNDIFGTINSTNKIIEATPLKEPQISDLLGQINLLAPTTITNNQIDFISKGSCHKTEEVLKKDAQGQPLKKLKEIDELSEELLTKSLKHEKRLKSFKKEPAKITLNDLANDKNKVSLQSKIAAPADLQNQLNKASTFTEIFDQRHTEIVPMVNQSMRDKPFVAPTNDISKTALTSLSSISIDLDQVSPLTGGERILLNDEHLSAILNITTDRPRLQVYVLVLTLNNKLSDTIIKNIQFHAGVKKPCKIHLQPPSDTELRPVKSFRPHVPITQVMLLWNPTQQSVDITGIIQYQVGDDPEPFSEPVIALDLPCWQ